MEHPRTGVPGRRGGRAAGNGRRAGGGRRQMSLGQQKSRPFRIPEERGAAASRACRADRADGRRVPAPLPRGGCQQRGERGLVSWLEAGFARLPERPGGVQWLSERAGPATALPGLIQWRGRAGLSPASVGPVRYGGTTIPAAAAGGKCGWWMVEGDWCAGWAGRRLEKRVYRAILGGALPMLLGPAAARTRAGGSVSSPGSRHSRSRPR